MKVAYFSNGHIGNGHFVRGLAISRALTSAHSFLSFEALPHGFRLQGLPVSPQTWRRSWLDFSPDVVLVDGARRHFDQLMGKVRAPVWTLVRATTQEWFDQNAQKSNAQKSSDRWFAIEPCVTFAGLERLEPIVLVNPFDCSAPDRLRELASLPPGGWLGAIVHAGLPGEFQQLRDCEAAAHWFRFCERVVSFDYHSPNQLDNTTVKFMGSIFLKGASRILGAAGYNFFWECNWLGYSHRTLHIPMCGERLVDDQGIRMRDTPVGYMMRENGAHQLARLIEALKV